MSIIGIFLLSALLYLGAAIAIALVVLVAILYITEDWSDERRRHYDSGITIILSSIGEDAKAIKGTFKKIWHPPRRAG